eukprot:m.118011 g.118011  ORF g.118011 m.118011 type:complete len:502 (-) comp9336_c0_seq1:451-1956(-)
MEKQVAKPSSAATTQGTGKGKLSKPTSSQLNAISENIVHELHVLYTQPFTGLVDVAAKIGMKLLPPRRKITVLLVGNHSAGKSSFVNWYIEETLQKTGVAMETNQLTLVTSGKKRERLGGEATVEAFPFLKGLAKEAGIYNSIVTEVSTSRQKSFPLITFVDTPGLVDGDMKYSFDIEKSLLWLGNMADLIIVFFDPMGQALSKKSLDVIEGLQIQCGSNFHKIVYCLSKADTAGAPKDRQKVILQIVQNMCRRSAFNQVALELPTIYIPNDDPLQNTCENQIDEICDKVDTTIQSVVQHALNQFKQDSATLVQRLDETLEKETMRRNSRCNKMFFGLSILWFASSLFLMGTVAFLSFVLGSGPDSGGEGADHPLPLFEMMKEFVVSISDPEQDSFEFVMPIMWRMGKTSFNVVSAIFTFISRMTLGEGAAPYIFLVFVLGLLYVGYHFAFKQNKFLSKNELKKLRLDKEVSFLFDGSILMSASNLYLVSLFHTQTHKRIM